MPTPSPTAICTRGEAPGHGFDIDEDLAARHPYRPANLPVNRLDDGSMNGEVAPTSALQPAHAPSREGPPASGLTYRLGFLGRRNSARCGLGLGLRQQAEA